MVIQKFWWNIAKGRRKFSFSHAILYFLCFSQAMYIGLAIYEADDLINELDRPSKYEYNYYNTDNAEAEVRKQTIKKQYIERAQTNHKYVYTCFKVENFKILNACTILNPRYVRKFHLNGVKM